MSYTQYTLTTNIQNDSLQTGDNAYVVPVQSLGTNRHFIGDKSDNNPDGVVQGQLAGDSFSGISTPSVAQYNYLGKVTDVGLNSITVQDANWAAGAGDYIIFEKEAKVNNATMTGYYLEVTMVNNSNKKAELFALSTEVTPSSK